MEEPRQTGLDALKGICILMVIITHYAWNDQQRILGLFPFWIDMAVPVFMMISGYVNTKSFKKNGITEIGKAFELKFVLKKFIRYTVPFLIAGTIEIIGSWLERNPIGVGKWADFFLAGGVGPGSYYYPIMIQFLLFFPLIYFTMEKDPKYGLLMWFILNGIYELIQKAYGFPLSTYRLLVFRYVFLIAFGIFISLYKNTIKKKTLFCSMIIGILYIIIVKYIGYETRIINNSWRGTNFLAALYIAPVFYLLFNKIAFWKNSFLELLGKASFNIFLTQMVYYAFLSRWLYDRIEVKSAGLALMINLFICLTAGICFYFAEGKITEIILKAVLSGIDKAKGNKK